MTRIRAWLGRDRHPVVATVGLVLLGVAAGAIGFSAQPAVSGDVGPGTLAVDPGVSGGDTVVGLPPLGEVVADTHAGPLAFDARVERIDLEQASVVVRGQDPARTLRGQIESDLSPLLWRLAWQSLAVAVVSGVVGGLVLPRRGLRSVAAVTAGAVGFVVVGGTVALVTFEPRSFDQPRFEGALARAPDIVNTVQRHIDDVGQVETRLEALSDRIVGLYRSVEGDTTPVGDRTTILHVSDVHSNLVGLQLAAETASRFGVDAILDTGDLTSFGADLEVVVADRVAAIETPYYVVPGNHDDAAVRAALEDAGVPVLDEEVAQIGDVTVLGVGEPTFTADNDVSSRLWEINVRRSAHAVDRLVSAHRPDVVAVHNPRQLAEAMGSFDVGLAGHTHEASLEYVDGSVVVVAGSAGATGVGALLTDEDIPYEMQLLHFEDDQLVAVDRLAFQGTDGAFELQRVLIDPTAVDGYPDSPPGVGPPARQLQPPR